MFCRWSESWIEYLKRLSNTSLVWHTYSLSRLSLEPIWPSPAPAQISLGCTIITGLKIHTSALSRAFRSPFSSDRAHLSFICISFNFFSCAISSRRFWFSPWTHWALLSIFFRSERSYRNVNSAKVYNQTQTWSSRTCKGPATAWILSDFPEPRSSTEPESPRRLCRVGDASDDGFWTWGVCGSTSISMWSVSFGWH